MSARTAYLVAVLGISGLGIGSLLVLELVRGEVDRGLVAQILSIVLPTLTALLALLRGLDNGQQIREVKESVKEGTAAAVDAAALSHRVAETVIPPARMPTHNLMGDEP